MQSPTVTTKPYLFGPQPIAVGQFCFRLWAPSAKTVSLVLHPNTTAEEIIPMQAFEADNEGWYKITHPAQWGDEYFFLIDNALRVPDPASRYQSQDVHGPSMLVDLNRHTPMLWPGKCWEETIIYELHVGTFTPAGTFLAIIDELDRLSAIGITAIELLPLGDFPGQYNWGYDGVLMFAPDSSYGTPDDLKTLIEACHQRGLQIFLDVVYNHFGPEGNYLWHYAKPFFRRERKANGKTPWGTALNFDGPDSDCVRSFFIENALFWLQDYGFDGLRLDAIHAISDDSEQHFLHELQEAVQAGPGQHRYVHIMLENHLNQSEWLVRANDENIAPVPSQWGDDFHHAMHVILTNERYSYYADYHLETSHHTPYEHLARALARGFSFEGEPSVMCGEAGRGNSAEGLWCYQLISFLQNHDMVGNRPYAERLPALVPSAEAYEAALKLWLLAPHIPMFFMGDEVACTQPFVFFTDVEPSLHAGIRRGRMRQFANHPGLKAKARQPLPDPCVASSFTMSKLDWTAALAQPNAIKFQSAVQQLLALRKQTIVPLLPVLKVCNTQWQAFNTTGVWVSWLNDTGQVLLQLVANMGDSVIDLPETFTDKGFTSVLQLDKPLKTTLPPWTVGWFVNATL